MEFPTGNSYRNEKKTPPLCLKLKNTKTLGSALQTPNNRSRKTKTVGAPDREMEKQWTLKWGLDNQKQLLIQARSKQKSIYPCDFQKIIKN